MIGVNFLIGAVAEIVRTQVFAVNVFDKSSIHMHCICPRNKILWLNAHWCWIILLTWIILKRSDVITRTYFQIHFSINWLPMSQRNTVSWGNLRLSRKIALIWMKNVWLASKWRLKNKQIKFADIGRHLITSYVELMESHRSELVQNAQ